MNRHFLNFAFSLSLSLCGFLPPPAASAAPTAYQKKTAKLMTRWGEALKGTDAILPEYPRPQMVRERWLNLNGIWQFQPAASATETLPQGELKREILVPFPVESALSGIMETNRAHVWYRRSFTVPAEWAGQRTLLHFGAVDYRCEVFVNGVSVGTHEGGYDPFTFDVTPQLTGSGAQDLALRVTDVTDDKGYPRGKQTLYPGGIMYTSTTGIWQTVWLEAVPQAYIGHTFRMTPDIDSATLKFYPNGMASGSALAAPKLRFKIYDGGQEVAAATENMAPLVTLSIPKPLKLWSPDSPFLYDMKIYLMDGNNAVDSVSTYFGMRKISAMQVNGYPRMCLNNKPLFHMGPLDQGFWPDGIYTAPTDEALRFDIEQTKAYGFNMTRKHIKVEPYRWYYWCDKLGLMVWQDMPSMNSYIGGGHPVPPREDAAYLHELEVMIKTHWNSPSIVSWVTFNEYQGSHDEASIVNSVKSWDDSRPVNVNSGCGQEYGDINTDIRDYHNYPAPVCPPKNTRNTQILVCGEYGGIGYYENGHIWQEGNPYESVTSYRELLEKYTLYGEMLIDFKNSKGLSAAVYTEITDVEMELNGLMTYDRKVFKGDIAGFAAVNRRIISEIRRYDEIAVTSEERRQMWKYTTVKPADGWKEAGFDDKAWSNGNGGFGNDNPPNSVIGTTWRTSDIWLRRTFSLPVGALDTGTLMLKVYYDEDCEVYINGVQAFTATGYITSYRFFALPEAARQALVEGGENTIAVHCHQTTGGQYIDAGIYRMTNPESEPEPEPTEPEPTNPEPNAVESVKKNACRVYPNPATDVLNIVRQRPTTEIRGIYSILGRLEKSPAPHDDAVNISDLTAGVHLLELATGNAREAIVFIKKQ
jgi:hypothetical protein